MGEVIHGNSNFGCADIVTSQGSKSFATPVMIPGMVESQIEVNPNETKIYADNKVWCIIKGDKGRTARVSFKNIPAAYAEHLGFKQNDNGSWSDTGKFKNHCIFFETEGYDCETEEKTKTLHYLYNVKASEPTNSTATDEDQIQDATFDVDYTCDYSDFVVDDDGEFVQYARITRTEENKALYDTFKSAVITPTSTIPTPPGP